MKNSEIETNSAYKKVIDELILFDDDKVSRLMKNFYVSKSDKMTYPELKERMAYFKETEESEREMSTILKFNQRRQGRSYTNCCRRFSKNGFGA